MGAQANGLRKSRKGKLGSLDGSTIGVGKQFSDVLDFTMQSKEKGLTAGQLVPLPLAFLSRGYTASGGSTLPTTLYAMFLWTISHSWIDLILE